MDREPCWECHGEGGYHDCGEDCCCCLDKEEITHLCQTCDGEGEYMQCVNLPHSETQMAAYRKRQAQAS
jgi:hypothetical protein